MQADKGMKDVKFSSTSNPKKVLIAAHCNCGNEMIWVTEGILLCEECKEYLKIELRSERLA